MVSAGLAVRDDLGEYRRSALRLRAEKGATAWARLTAGQNLRKPNWMSCARREKAARPSYTQIAIDTLVKLAREDKRILAITAAPKRRIAEV